MLPAPADLFKEPFAPRYRPPTAGSHGDQPPQVNDLLHPQPLLADEFGRPRYSDGPASHTYALPDAPPIESSYRAVPGPSGISYRSETSSLGSPSFEYGYTHSFAEDLPPVSYDLSSGHPRYRTDAAVTRSASAAFSEVSRALLDHLWDSKAPVYDLSDVEIDAMPPQEFEQGGRLVKVLGLYTPGGLTRTGAYAPSRISLSADLSPEEARDTLGHELVHHWQYRSGAMDHALSTLGPEQGRAALERQAYAIADRLSVAYRN